MKNLYWRNGGWWFSKMEGGVRRWTNLHTKDEAVAIAAIGKHDLRERPMARTEIPIKGEIEEFLAFMLRMGELRPVTAEGYRLTLMDFGDRLPPETTLASVRFEDVNNYAECLRKRIVRRTGLPYSESSVRVIVARVSSMLEWAVREKRLRVDNPCRRIRWPQFTAPVRTEWVDHGIANKLIKAAPNDGLRLILFCGFHAGLRRNEITEARCDWFFPDRGYMMVRNALGPPRLRPGERLFKTKNGKERTIPLSRDFKKFLIRYLRGRAPLDFALHPEVPHGIARYRYDWYKPYNDYMASKKCRHITPHIMRHSFGSNLASLDVSIYKIAVWMGDEVRTAAKHYAKLRPADEAIHVLDG